MTLTFDLVTSKLSYLVGDLCTQPNIWHVVDYRALVTLGSFIEQLMKLRNGEARQYNLQSSR